jgi:hypothetical protein
MYYNPLFLQTPSLVEQAFYQTDLGKLYRGIPFKELATKIAAPNAERSGRGRKPLLKVEGGIALLILKHYLGLSSTQTGACNASAGSGWDYAVSGIRTW